MSYLCSFVFEDTMVPNIEKDYILRLAIVLYIRNMILLGSTTKKTLLSSSLQCQEGPLDHKGPSRFRV